jgi:aerobic C4-dicarboxylate transport protein
LAILVGVDRFMSECRALTNLVGNGVATLVVARWEGELDRGVLARELEAGPARAEAAERRDEPLPERAVLAAGPGLSAVGDSTGRSGAGATTFGRRWRKRSRRGGRRRWRRCTGPSARPRGPWGRRCW